MEHRRDSEPAFTPVPARPLPGKVDTKVDNPPLRTPKGNTEGNDPPFRTPFGDVVVTFVTLKLAIDSLP
jgi:hypothetical protein